MRKNLAQQRNTLRHRFSQRINGLLAKFSLQNRLFFLFMMILTISIIAVGTCSYLKAKDMTKATKEDRLVRETELIGHIASNLKFLYISDEDYFKQQLTINIREQQRILHHEGIKSKYFYITEGEVIPFSIDNNEIPQIPQHLLDTMTTMDNITHHVRDEFEQMSLKTKGNLDIAHKANTSITELMEGIVKVSEQLRGIQSELKEVEGILPELESVSEHFSPVSQETLASTDEMLTSSEQQVQQIEKTHQVGLKLRDLSMKLKKEIERFTISS